MTFTRCQRNIGPLFDVMLGKGGEHPVNRWPIEAQSAQRFHHAADERLRFDFAQHAAQRPADGAEDVDVVVGVDVRRGFADEIQVAVVLGAELDFDFFGSNPDQSLQKLPEREESTVYAHERGH